ncbi:3-octaprenyl-4-hydroxybenzoate carboxy-lyase [Methanohalobium evestigatum Z-7303]|uniref:Flavin prenyltransferase UbiX n=1 Tax=Methanohalobium evestigatum (strain ATCC BAA-1072 / DSM 3721 / NBRC 107634 / OCM 161 / Z-7303) TaxID=644295 RepID=D7E872_METEZ|nr:3-octaprenyl-4-hydroxybenzoate carboxy-lyase [Methanohalobium evestigatum Z-7303]
MIEIAIGISGASGVHYGIRLVEILSGMDNVFTHLVITESAKKLIGIESEYSVLEIEDMASRAYNEKDFTAPIASGSHRFAGMIVAPCSMKTLGSVANGITDNLLTRSADVCMKERRSLVLMTRETPLNQIHIENMLKATQSGATILPACPGFYSNPQTIEDLLNTMSGRALDLLGIENEVFARWK